MEEDDEQPHVEVVEEVVDEMDSDNDDENGIRISSIQNLAESGRDRGRTDIETATSLLDELGVDQQHNVHVRRQQNQTISSVKIQQIAPQISQQTLSATAPTLSTTTTASTGGAAGRHFYAIRGNQVFKIDKITGEATPIKATSTSNSGGQLKFHVVSTSKHPTTSSDSTVGVKHVLVQQPQQQEDIKSPFLQTTVATISRPTNYSGNIGTAAQTQSQIPSAYVPPKLATKRQKPQQPLLGHRKPCNCNKSQCLKLYCECFANGEFCRGCNCKECHNNLEYETERSKAIRSSLERNPNAFRPKIGKGRSDVERLHQKGCHCKKSNCLKNYCECYEAKVPCTDRCKCNSCRNTESDRQHKLREKFGGVSGLLHLAAAAADARSSSPFSDTDSDLVANNAHQSEHKPDPKTLPWFYMTDEVVEATTLCLVAQAEEQETSGCIEEADIERAILREFGRCLQQIIDNASYSTTSRTTQDSQ